MTLSNTDFIVLLPLLILTGYACVLMLLDLVIQRKQWTGWLALVGFVAAALGMLPWHRGETLTGFGGMVKADGFAVFLTVVFLVTGALTVLLALSYLPRTGLERGEFYVLLMFTVSGMILMAQAADLVIVFLALEMLSIPLYILS